MSSSNAKLFNLNPSNSIGTLLTYGFLVRLTLLAYSALHDILVDHIKYTDVDYHVFTNGSRALVNGTSPYDDKEYRYTPLVALIFVPNILINQYAGKFMLIFADVLVGRLLYIINIYQGVHRSKSRLFLQLWLFNPITIAISTRGSFEPVLLLTILASLYFLIIDDCVIAGLLYGICIHMRLYPIIYCLGFYIYLIQKKPYLRNQSKLWYWTKTFTPSLQHYKFGLTSLISLATSTYISYRFYGDEYLEQSLFYHLKRRDLQHNFSIYFYLFKLLPQYEDKLNLLAFLIQSLTILMIFIQHMSFDSNKRVRLRKLTFYLYASTYAFVSLNKVCTSQYFTWYLIFIPLITDSLSITKRKSAAMVTMWLATQGTWLLFAYLYEYQKMSHVLNLVGYSSMLFLLTNMWILITMTASFDAFAKWKSLSDEKDN